MEKYDLLIVGSGLFGAVITAEAIKKNKKVLVIEKRDHIGGNCYTYCVDGINVHKYGAHIFRTSDRLIWDYVNQFCEFNNFVNSPIANYKNEIYNMPFNMNTYHALWGVNTPKQAMEMIESQKVPYENPKNLEEHILSLAGKDIYEKLVKGYTEKQWGKDCKELPPSIMRRIPLRFTYDNNYFNDRWQGIPIGGYTKMLEKMFSGSDIVCNTDYLSNREKFNGMAEKIVYTGTIDSFFDYCYGALEYRSLKFEHEIKNEKNYQGVAVVNYTDKEVPFTRIIEHKHFEFGTGDTTVISKEYPMEWDMDKEPYYPKEDIYNVEKYNKYKELSKKEDGVIFGGRLGEYRYYDMQDTIKSALETSKILF